MKHVKNFKKFNESVFDIFKNDDVVSKSSLLFDKLVDKFNKRGINILQQIPSGDGYGKIEVDLGNTFVIDINDMYISIKTKGSSPKLNDYLSTIGFTPDIYGVSTKKIKTDGYMYLDNLTERIVVDFNKIKDFISGNYESI